MAQVVEDARAIRERRLARLEAVARQIPPERFTMGGWTVETLHKTLHCLGSWAALDPEFNAEGFYLDRTGIPIYEEFGGLKACQIFFGLMDRETSLFKRSSYAGYQGAFTLKRVIENICRLRQGRPLHLHICNEPDSELEQ